MKARVDSARTSLKHHVRLSLALVGLALAVLVIFVPGSGANLAPPNTFAAFAGPNAQNGFGLSYDTIGDYNGAPGIGPGEPFNVQFALKLIF